MEQRLVKCPYVSCESKVPFLELLDHMKGKKECSEETIDNFAIKTEIQSKNTRSIALVVKDKATFIASSCVSGGLFYHWIQLYGSSNEAKITPTPWTSVQVLCHY